MTSLCNPGSWYALLMFVCPEVVHHRFICKKAKALPINFAKVPTFHEFGTITKHA